MDQPNPRQRDPSLLKHTGHSLAEEWRAWLGLVRAEWKWILLLVSGLVMLLAYSRPFPPREVYLAVGQHGTTFEALGQKMQPYFAEHGIELNLVNTTGSAQSLADLADKDVRVNAALMVGGLAAKGQFPNLLSLGSIEYVPLWLFYRGPEFRGPNALAYFADKKVAIGPEGSATWLMLGKLLELSGVALDSRPNFLRIPNREAVGKLLDGEIDAVCIIDAIDSPNVRKLLEHPDVRIYSFDYAPAYVKKLPFLSTVTIPKGSLDLRANYPDHDIQMLASTTTLLVDKNLHPLVQEIFVLASDEIGNEVDQFFAKPEFFPAYVDHTIPLSPVAKRIFDHGPPSLQGTLPLWLISYMSRIWLLLLGLVAVVYPMFKMFPSYRGMRSAMLINEIYEEMLEIERTAATTASPAELRSLIERLDVLEADGRENWIASNEMNHLYNMRTALFVIRARIAEQLAAAGARHGPGGASPDDASASEETPRPSPPAH